ncbi:MAG: 4-hydroxy-tetrahydrodipicolinate reductase [Clostridia bacterium]|nr:4-hydroxy-tetrahydrodipicolinate reductase [Clostridia bacterium]
MKVIINGACGRMGRKLIDKLSENGAELFAAVDKFVPDDAPVACFERLCDCPDGADVIIDFSVHTCAKDICDYVREKKIPVVIATTGHNGEELELIKDAACFAPVFYAGNMSLGVALLVGLAKKAALVMKDADIEIVETHHNQKLDAPSGTALMIADGIKSVLDEAEYVYGRHGHHKREKKEIGIHSIRSGNIVGIHEVIINTGNESLTLKHEAYDRGLFADGAFAAAAYIIGKKPGMYDMYGMLSID